MRIKSLVFMVVGFAILIAVFVENFLWLSDAQTPEATLSADACAAIVAANSQAEILTSINSQVIVYGPVEASAAKSLCNPAGNVVSPLPTSTGAMRHATVARIPQGLCKELAGVMSMNIGALVRVNGQRILQGHPHQTSAVNFCRDGQNDVEVTWAVDRPDGLPAWTAISSSSS